MNREIFSYLKIAGKIAAKGQKRSFSLGAVARRKDGVIVQSFNGPTRFPEKGAHAEQRLSKKVDVGSVVYVARILQSDGSFAMAKPCDSCMRALISRGVKRVYWTVAPNEFGWADL